MAVVSAEQSFAAKRHLNVIQSSGQAARDILFIQGAGPEVHDTWDVHLVEGLRRELGPSYEVRYPRMPDEADPGVRTWGPVIARELAALRPAPLLPVTRSAARCCYACSRKRPHHRLPGSC